MLSLKSRWLFCCQLVFFSVVCHSEKSVPNIYGNYVCTGHEIILEIVEVGSSFFLSHSSLCVFFELVFIFFPCGQLSVQILLESDVHGNFQPETSNTRGPNNPGRLLFAFGHAHESQLGSKEVHTASFTGFFDSVISPSNGKNVRNALDAMTNVMVCICSFPFNFDMWSFYLYPFLSPYLLRTTGSWTLLGRCRQLSNRLT